MALSTSDTASNDPRRGSYGYGLGRITSVLTEFAAGMGRDVLLILSSRKVQKRILTTAVVVISSSVLYGIAVLAYLLFYHNFLPDQITTVPVHLQYGYGVNPWGVASLSHTNLKNLQPYDISVSLTLPRSPPNLGQGNFMVALHLLDDRLLSQQKQNQEQPTPQQPTSSYLTSPNGGHPLLPVQRDPTFYFRHARSRILFTSTRPALLPYTHPLVTLASRVLFMPYYLVSPSAETTVLKVSLTEHLNFPRGGNLPTSVFVEVQAGQELQVYSASMTFAAQLAGLRWFMYQWRGTAFVLFTVMFWGCEVLCMGVTWLAVAVWLGGGTRESDDGAAVVKVEGGKGEGVGNGKGKGKQPENDDGLSDTERTFPSTSRQPPLKFEGRIKQEEGIAEGIPLDVHPAVEADDEDNGEPEEDDGGPAGSAYRDSGIGTSYDDNVSREGVTRRPSRR